MENSQHPDPSQETPYADQVSGSPDVPEAQDTQAPPESNMSIYDRSTKKSVSMAKIVVGTLLIIAVLFTPIPYYESQQVMCKMGQTCPTPGWRVTGSLAAYGFALATRSSQSQGVSRVVEPQNGTQIIAQPSTRPDTSSAQGTGRAYTNAKIGFSLTYPTSYTLEQSDDSIRFTTPNNNLIELGWVQDTSSTIAEYLAKSDKISSTAWEGQPSKAIVSTKKTKINDFSVIQRVEQFLAAGDGDRTITYFKIGSYMLAVSLVTTPGNDPTKDAYIYNEIVSSIHLQSSVISPQSSRTAPTCIPRPACLDTNPRCMMPETENMCPAKLNVTGQFCGGIAGKTCPSGYTCKYDGTYPDAGGTCVASKQKYSCPANGWVDCMPGPDAKPECSTEAMSWYKANCPNFQGGAL